MAFQFDPVSSNMTGKFIIKIAGFPSYRHSSYSAGIETIAMWGLRSSKKKKSLNVALADEKNEATYPLTLWSSNNQAQQWNKKKI